MIRWWNFHYEPMEVQLCIRRQPQKKNKSALIEPNNKYIINIKSHIIYLFFHTHLRGSSG